VTAVIDLHAYLGEFDPFGLKPLADQWEAAGVGWVIAVGDDVATSEAALDAAWSLPNTIAGVGLHSTKIPASGVDDELATLAELATDPQVAVLTDVGVDDRAEASHELQEDVLRAVAEIAVANKRSLLIDWPGPAAALLELWASLDRTPRAALLTFAGDTAEAQRLLENGFYFSVSPEADQGALVSVPADRLFVHSSARAANGGRGPAVVRDVLNRLAAARGVDADALAAQINDNLWEFVAWRPK
jgi:Tat protein secretion system quality control protein TatD with DNase activity